jgi:hypothetical protein
MILPFQVLHKYTKNIVDKLKSTKTLTLKGLVDKLISTKQLINPKPWEMKTKQPYKSLQVPVFMRIWAVPTDRGSLRAFYFGRGEKPWIQGLETELLTY